MPNQLPLTSDRICDAAWAIAQAEGEPAVTMRAVGRLLGVSAMAVYHHIESAEKLRALMLTRAAPATLADAVNEAAAVEDPSGRDIGRRRVARQLRRLLIENSAQAEVIGAGTVIGVAAAFVAQAGQADGG